MDGAGIPSNWSNPWTFTMDTVVVNPPTLLTPADNVCSSDTTPDFDWQDEPGAATYQLQVDNSGDGFPSPEINPIALATSSYTPVVTLAAGLYSWHVKGVSTLGTPGNWSVTRHLSINTSATS